LSCYIQLQSHQRAARRRRLLCASCSNGRSDAHSDRFAYTYSYTDTYTYTYTYTYTDPNTYCYSDSYPYNFTHTDASTNPDPSNQADTERSSYSNTASNVGSLRLPAK